MHYELRSLKIWQKHSAVLAAATAFTVAAAVVVAANIIRMT